MAENNAAVHEKGFINSKVTQSELNKQADQFDYSGLATELRDNIRIKRITATAEYRIGQLNALRQGIADRLDDINAALAQEHGRHVHECFLESMVSVGEIDHAISNLASWMEPTPSSTPLLYQPGSSKVLHQPKGVVLIIAPWNFPIYLAFSGFIAAISAGNACVLKPSEITPKCSQLIQEIFTKYLDPRIVRIVLGGVPETTALLRVRWDHILYTGNGAVGRIIYQAASKFLTPVTLELGGKSPVYVDKSANLSATANRIMAAKMVNNGQICIAPDYVLVHESVSKELIKELSARVKTWLGDQPQKCSSYSRIINTHHFDRVKKFLDDNHGGEIMSGGLQLADRADKFIPPTVVVNPSLNSLMMQEEIFGPVLPVLVVHDENEAIDFINARESPLAIYVFAEDSAVYDKVLDKTLGGNSCVNDVLYQCTNPHLPFGGVGTSGLGKYHGKDGFDELSHHRGVLIKGTWPDPSARYMPYDEAKVDVLRKIVIGPLFPPMVKQAAMVGGVVVAGLVLKSYL